MEVECVGMINDLDHPWIAQWLKQHGRLISQLTMEVDVSADRLKLRDFFEAAAPCRSIDLAFTHFPNQMVDLADLAPIAGSLQGLNCEPNYIVWGSLRGTSAFNSMSQLTGLRLNSENLGNEEPWGLLARLTGLQRLSLQVRASGDPSPLSALTGLSAVFLRSHPLEAGGGAPFSFSSLQPLSTLQQLVVLHLGDRACAATSLQGLAGLSSLKVLMLQSSEGEGLVSLEGINPGVVTLSMVGAVGLVSLAGIEGCTLWRSSPCSIVVFPLCSLSGMLAV
jgi:hypothetical protein